MKYIKATKQQCEDYNAEVTQGENYQGGTSQWAKVQEVEGSFYIALHPNYTTELLTVNKLPKIEEEI
jgi:hypothetical protein